MGSFDGNLCRTSIVLDQDVALPTGNGNGNRFEKRAKIM